MASDVFDIKVKAEVYGKRDVDGLVTSLEKTSMQGKLASAGLGSAREAFSTLGTAAGIAGGIIVGVGAAAKEAWQLIGEGAALLSAQEKFDNLAVSIDTTADSLMGNLRAATKGMVSDAALIESATQIINLGMGKTEDEVIRLATAVSALGVDMDILTLTLANNSGARLDSLGLSLEGVREKVEELEGAGFKGDAFDEAVLLALEEKMTLFGDAAETTAGQMSILEAEMANMKNQALQIGAAISGPAIESAADLVEIKGRLRDLAREGEITWGEYEKLLLEATFSNASFNRSLEELDEALKEMEDSAEGAAKSTGLMDVAASILAPKLEDLADQYLYAADSALEAADADGKLLFNYTEHHDLIGELVGGYDPLLERLHLAAIREDELRQRTLEANTEMRKQGNEVIPALASKMDFLIEKFGVASARIKALDDNLGRLDGRQVNVDVNVRTHGTIPSGGGGAPKGDKPTQNNDAFASGGSFMVPAGYPNDSYSIGVSSGEYVNVSPADRGRGAGGITINVYGAGRSGVQIGQQVASQVTDALGRMN